MSEVTKKSEKVTTTETRCSSSGGLLICRYRRCLFYNFSAPKVPPASVPMAKPNNVDDPHFLGLDLGLHCINGAVSQCHKSGGQEVDGDETGEYWNRFVALKVTYIHYIFWNICSQTFVLYLAYIFPSQFAWSRECSTPLQWIKQ